LFQQVDLTGAVFNRTILIGADFTTAQHFVLDPDLNMVKKARFSLNGLPGLLAKHGIVVE
jgi:fluoroquinolone resistance protein